VEVPKRRRESRKEKTGVVAPLSRQMTSPEGDEGLVRDGGVHFTEEGGGGGG
jgi:hypothetical protein